MNDPDLFRGNRAIDISRLNPAELRVLRLLGRGHTAKSIANELCTTTAAVNERLREARRKTGVSSSRELARLLTAQENRDEQMGVGRGGAPNATVVRANANRWRRSTGVIAMMAACISIVAAVAVTSLQSSGGGEPASAMIDPQLGTIPAEGPSWLYRIVRIQTRDRKWAPAAEQALRERYRGIEFFSMKPTVLRVTCAATLCEVAATFPAPRLGSTYTMQPSLIEDMKRMGLLHSGELITGAAGDPPKGIYLAYYQRIGS